MCDKLGRNMSWDKFLGKELGMRDRGIDLDNMRAKCKYCEGGYKVIPNVGMVCVGCGVMMSREGYVLTTDNKKWIKVLDGCLLVVER